MLSVLHVLFCWDELVLYTIVYIHVLEMSRYVSLSVFVSREASYLLFLTYLSISSNTMGDTGEDNSMRKEHLMLGKKQLKSPSQRMMYVCVCLSVCTKESF